MPAVQSLGLSTADTATSAGLSWYFQIIGNCKLDGSIALLQQMMAGNVVNYEANNLQFRPLAAGPWVMASSS